VPTGIAGLLALVLAAAAPAARGSSNVTGPPPGHTGGFGEPTCQECHTGLPLNDPASTLSVLGLGDGYEPGRSYRVTVRVEGDRFTTRAGFQAAFRWEEGPRRAFSAGELGAPGPGMRIVTDSAGRVRYIEHTLEGVEAPGGTREWTFEWTAPAAAGPISFHVAANAANGDDSPLDDLIYTASRRLAPAGGAP